MTPDDPYKPYRPPPKPPKPQRNPALQVVLWLVAFILVIFIAGLFVLANKHPQPHQLCPAGTSWNTYTQSCN